MARASRVEKAGGWYHVTARGNERKAIYRDRRHRLHFLEILAEMVARFRVRLHVFVLMDNHDHLLLELTEANLSLTVKWLNVGFSVWYGDAGRDMALCLGQRLCGLQLAALAAEVGLRNYGVVSTNIKRYERRLVRDPSEQAGMNGVLQLFNCEM